MNPRGYLINGNFYDENISDSKLDLVTPLYTEKPIVKELTDEEMMKAEYEFMYWNRSLNKPLVEISYELGVFKQAVAILKKARGE